MEPGHDDTVRASNARTPAELTHSLTSDGEAEPAAEWRPVLPGQIDRYYPLAVLGAGGMGVVYAAYDPDLDRKVALKLLRPDRLYSGASARLLREAQAQARISHPNVVQIHDTGMIGAEIFLTMEFVAGVHVRAWLGQQPRGLGERMRVLIDAGRGLAAAHDAGLIHRDFKPENVLVGDDGRVRVTDFGLARAHGQADLAPTVRDGRALDLILTAPGDRLGTPAYMSPEQFLGLAVDARSDQFSFCVTLYEALHGQRPFAGANVGELGSALLREPLPGPRSSEVPAWITSVLARGLSRAPEQRYPGMAELLHALTDDPAQRRRRRRGIAGVVLIGAMGAIGGGFVMSGPRSEEAAVCAGAPARLAAVWQPAVGDSLRAAFAQTALPYADDVAASVQRRLDIYADAWAAASLEACETHRRGEQSDALYDRRMACLGDRFTAMRALVDVLATATPEVVENAVRAADALPLLERCSDARALLAQRAPPEDPAVARAVAALREPLARVWVLNRLGQRELARAELAPLRAQLEQLGYGPPLAEALHLEGKLAVALGEYPLAESTFFRVVALADAVGDDERRAYALSDLVNSVGVRQARFAEGQRHGELARGVVERLTDRGPVEADLELRLGELALAQHDFATATRHIARATELFLLHYGENSTMVAAAVDADATAEYIQGHYGEALAKYRRAEAIFLAAYGPDHPRIAIQLNNIGAAELSMLDFDAADRTFTRVLAIQRRGSAAYPLVLASTHSNLGQIALGKAEYARALVELGKSLAIFQASLPPDHPDIGDGWHQLGQAHHEHGDFAAAEQDFAQALAVNERAFPAGHSQRIWALTSLAESQRRGGRLGQAEASLARAAAEFTGPDDDPGRGRLEAGLGKLRVSQGRFAEAAPLLEAGLAHMRRNSVVPPFEVARTEFALAEALWRGDPATAARARALAEAARAGLARMGPQFVGDVAGIEAWLASLPVVSG